MTDLAKKLLDKIKNDELFKKHEFIFVGGTALSYHIHHRVSEDLDFAFTADIPIYDVRAFSLRHGGIYLADPTASVFRINTGIDLDSRHMRFLINDVKVEFFYPSDPLSQDCLGGSKTSYDESAVKVLNVRDIARMKVKALMDRVKIRDIFDISEILKKGILSEDEFFIIAKEYAKKDEVAIIDTLEKMVEQKDDESLYFSEGEMVPSFDDLKLALYSRLDRHLKKRLIQNEKSVIECFVGKTDCTLEDTVIKIRYLQN